MTAIHVLQRRRSYSIDLSAGRTYTIVLRYSRFRGNFTKDLTVTSR